jgi:hypothetical protein
VWSLSASVQVDTGDADVYLRYVDFGILKVDFSTSAQTSSITRDPRDETILRAWDTSPSFATDYLAATDGIVVAGFNGGLAANNTAYMQGKTDSSSTPTTIRGSCGVDEKGGIQHNSFMMAVRKGDYWRVDRSGTEGTQFLNWLPLS